MNIEDIVIFVYKFVRVINIICKIYFDGRVNWFNVFKIKKNNDIERK